MRSCATDIAEIAGDEADVFPPSPADTGEADPAGNDLVAACGRALGAVDQLLAGIAEARRLAARQAGWDPEAFSASRAMVRLLLADRAAADACARELLWATAGYLRHPPAATAGRGGQEGTVGQVCDGPVGAPEAQLRGLNPKAGGREPGSRARNPASGAPGGAP
jgi:hypothetical protein